MEQLQQDFEMQINGMLGATARFFDVPAAAAYLAARFSDKFERFAGDDAIDSVPASVWVGTLAMFMTQEFLSMVYAPVPGTVPGTVSE
jgi:hypothetical protein